MATGTKICKICGAEYPYCKTVFKPGVFRWSDVACSDEHGAEYLAKIIASRSEAKAAETKVENDAVAVVDNEVGGGDERVEAVEAKPEVKKTRRKKVEAEEPAIEE